MTEENGECSYVVDCSGLHEIATTKSDNLKSLYIDRLSKGIIGVPTRVWQEFEEIYAEEAEALAPNVSRKLKMKPAYNVGAASIADKISSRFSRSPYDRHSDLYAASICMIENYTLLTTTPQLQDYAEMKCCEVLDLVAWADGQGSGQKKKSA